MGEVVHLPRETGGDLAALWEFARGLAARVERLEAENARLRADVSPGDVGLVAALHGAVGGVFTVKEVVARAEDDVGLSDALKSAVKTALSSRAIGRRLGALEGRDLGGLIVKRGNKERDGAVWVIEQALRLSKSPKSQTP